MADEIKEAGNETPSEGDLREDAESPAPESESRGDQREPEDWKRKYLEEGKPAQEEANRLRARVAELERLKEQSPAAPEAASANEDEAAWAEIRTAAAAGQGWARVMLKEREERDRLVKALVDKDQLDRISDTAERDEVAAHYMKNRHRLGDPQAARAEIREKKLAEQVTRLEAQVASLSKKNDPDVVRTVTREVDADEHKKRTEMTVDEFDRKVAALEAEGSINAARDLRRKLDRREITLTRRGP